MPVKTVGFTIKIPMARETADTQKAIDKQKKTIVELQKKDLPKLTKATKEYLGTAKKAFNDTGREAEQMGRTFSRSMEDGLRSLHRMSDGVGKLRERLLNIKTVLAGTAVGIAAIWAGKKLYEGGKANLATRGRIGREFGDESGFLEETARRAGHAGGVSADDATKALIPFRERLDDIEEGAQFRGMRKKLTAVQAKALREKNLTFGAGLLSRVSAMAPDIDEGQAGSVLADALAGPEGIKRLVTEFNLSRRSRTVAQANEKGEVFKYLRAEEKQKYGINKKGQYLEQGDLVNILLERSGITEAAAEAKRKKMDFQLKQIGAEAENALADIGARAFDKFNNGMSKGTTLAEKFENAIKSKEGQRVLDGISSAVVGIAEGAVKIATTVPKIGAFLSEHKGTLAALGVTFAALKGMSFVGGKMKGLEGGAGGILGALGIGAKPIPVYIVSGPGGALGATGEAGGKLSKLGKIAGGASAVLAAGSAGYAVGTELDNWLGLSDKISKGLFKSDEFAAGGLRTSQNELSVAKVIMARVNAGKETGAQAAAEFQRFASSAEGKGKDQLSEVAKQLAAMLAAQKPAQLVVDGRVLAEIVSEHQERAVKNSTAGGGAPLHRE